MLTEEMIDSWLVKDKRQLFFSLESENSFEVQPSDSSVHSSVPKPVVFRSFDTNLLPVGSLPKPASRALSPLIGPVSPSNEPLAPWRESYPHEPTLT